MAYPRAPCSSTPRPRTDSAKPDRVALEARHEARGERDGERRPPGEARRRDEPVVVDEERVGAERKPDDCQPQPVDDRDPDLVGREVDRADHGQRRAFPEQRAAARRPRQRRDQDHAECARGARRRCRASAAGPAREGRCTSSTTVIAASAQIRSIRNAAVGDGCEQAPLRGRGSRAREPPCRSRPRAAPRREPANENCTAPDGPRSGRAQRRGQVPALRVASSKRLASRGDRARRPERRRRRRGAARRGRRRRAGPARTAPPSAVTLPS